jgi:uncharacterized phage protein (TIGR02220 family)
MENLEPSFETEFHGAPQLPSFLMMPSSVIKLGFDYAIVLGIIYAYSKGSMSVCKLKNETIANMIGRSKNNVSLIINNLDKKGYLRVNLERNSNGTFRFITVPDGIYGVIHRNEGDHSRELGGSSVGISQKNSKEDLVKKEDTTKDYSSFLFFLNQTLKKNYRGDSKSKVSFKNRLKEGFTLKDIEYAIKIIAADPFHRDNQYKYATPEFILRPDKLDRFLNMKTEQQTITTQTNAAFF